MKTNTLSLLIFAALLLTACASEDTTNKQEQQQQPETKGLTEFVVTDGTTRTTTEYFDNGGTNRGLHFYWTEGDRLWVNNGTLIQDARNNIDSKLESHPTIPTAVKRAATAKFYFNGTFTALSYPVRYTGKGNLVGDKITIKAEQNQAIANDASHIGEDGDCGTAIATKPTGGGQYNFALDHKAAYVTFIPYTSQSVISSAIITQIKVTADKAICGQFNFNDNGIDVDNSRPVASPANQSVTLTLNTSATNTGFPIPGSAANPSKNAAVMVLAPGTYSTFTVEYTLHDNATNQGGTITKTYNNITLTAGKNKRVAADLKLKDYTPWGNFDSWKYVPGTPNVNELLYYVLNGDPHYDNSPWVFRGHLYRGGVWLKKQTVIYNDLRAAGYTQLTAQSQMKERFYRYLGDATGWDFRTQTYTSTNWFNNRQGVLASTPPTDTSDYFYLPALGCPGNYPIGDTGYYWSASHTPISDSNRAAFFCFTSSTVAVASNAGWAFGFPFHKFE